MPNSEIENLRHQSYSQKKTSHRPLRERFSISATAARICLSLESTITYDIVQPGKNLELPQCLFVDAERRLAKRGLRLRDCHLIVAHVQSQRGPSNRLCGHPGSTLAARP